MHPTMEPRERILLAWSRLEEANYYELLSVEPGVDRSGLQRAFHRFANAYHPDRHVDEDEDLREKARLVFQRGVEAYSVLRDPRMAAAYDKALASGARRLSPEQLEQLSRPEPAPARPKAAPPGFVGQMKTPDGREVADRVERLFSEGRYADAYQQLGLLEQVEPDNEAVRTRLAQLSRMVKARH
jgi:DnaJ-class molecular chaperone